MTNGRNAAIVGFIFADLARPMLVRALSGPPLKLRRGGKVFATVMGTFDAIETPVLVEGGQRGLVRSAELMSLLAIAWAVSQPDEPAPAPEVSSPAASSASLPA